MNLKLCFLMPDIIPQPSAKMISGLAGQRSIFEGTRKSKSTCFLHSLVTLVSYRLFKKRLRNMGPPRRALIAVTSAHASLYPEGKETGLFVTEALHPYNVFKQHGFEVELVSETGSYQADWLSQQPDWLKDDDKKVWEDPQSEFRQKLDKGLKPNDLNPDNVSTPDN
jgi:hypothetical protein